MNIDHFGTFVQECQRIQRAFDFLPDDFCSDGVFAAWEAGGIFCPDWGSLNHEPQFSTCNLTRWWVNVAAHMSVSAVLGFKLAHASSGADTRSVIEALLIHDWNKRHEINCLRTGHYDVGKIYNATLKANEELLRWFSDPLVNLASVAGHGGVVVSEKRVLSLEEKIVFYADMCTSGSVTVPYEQRLGELQSRMGQGMPYQNTEKYFQKKYKVSHQQKHSELLGPIEVELAKLAQFDGPQKNLPLHLAPKEFQS